MRPKVKTEAHQTKYLAELVCSNSFRSDDKEYNAVGVLHEELRIADSLIMKCADKNKVPAGSALAVDRDNFSKEVNNTIKSIPNINIINKEIKDLNEFKNQIIIVSTGPLTSKRLTESIIIKTSENSLAFYDAIAPIVYEETINMSVAWKQSRYDKGNGDDYINCPFSKEEYYQFIDKIKKLQKWNLKNLKILHFLKVVCQ